MHECLYLKRWQEIVYTAASDSEQNARNIAIYGTASGKSLILKNISPVNNMKPKWSSGGAFILFSHVREDNGCLCIGIYDIRKKRLRLCLRRKFRLLEKMPRQRDYFLLFGLWTGIMSILMILNISINSCLQRETEEIDLSC